MDFRELLTHPSPSMRVKLLRVLLRALSLPYRMVIGGRNFLYEAGLKASHQSSLLVISVGNLSAGGTGKSPVVAWLVRWLRSHGIRVAVLSRGYGELDQGQNDEALELELKHPDVPHLQHWDRVASAKIAEQELEMEALVLDDAFQHRRIARDIDIVLIDATDSPAAQWLLPGGLYREPLSSLRRADFVILTRADQADEQDLQRLHQLVRRHAPLASVAEARHRPSSIVSCDSLNADVSVLDGASVLAFCGIGNPNSFFESLSSLGATIVDRRVWPDHHPYNQADVQSLSAWANSHTEAKMVVCTMKDWVKLRLPQLGDLRLSALRIELDFISGQAKLEQLMQEVVSSLRESSDGQAIPTD